MYTKTTKDLIDSIVDGYNATVFAYGPTGKKSMQVITLVRAKCEYRFTF